jgi:hypothetical protein
MHRATVVMVLSVSVSLALGAAPAAAQIDQLLRRLGVEASSGPSDIKVGSALKEALQIGSEKAVELTRIRAW